MHLSSVTVFVLGVLALSPGGRALGEEGAVLKGPYLGQKPPGKTPKVFAPKIICTGAEEGACSFSSDGRFFWYVRSRSSSDGIFGMEMVDGVWTPPRLASFSAGGLDWDFVLAPDDRSMFIASGRPAVDGGEPLRDYDIWLSEKSEGVWSDPRRLPPPVNLDSHDSFPSVSQSGTLYFFSRRKGGVGEGDIYRAPRVDGEYRHVESAGPAINSPFDEVDPFIAPDESYLIFCSNKPGGLGSYDMYVSFRKADGTWTEGRNMGETLNSPNTEYIPYVSRDGRYFFFTSDPTGQRDIFWVDASVIEDLR